VGASLGGMTLPWLMGVLLEGVAATAVLWTLLIGLLISGGLFSLILRHEKVRGVEE